MSGFCSGLGCPASSCLAPRCDADVVCLPVAWVGGGGLCKSEPRKRDRASLLAVPVKALRAEVMERTREFFMALSLLVMVCGGPV